MFLIKYVTAVLYKNFLCQLYHVPSEWYNSLFCDCVISIFFSALWGILVKLTEFLVLLTGSWWNLLIVTFNTDLMAERLKPCLTPNIFQFTLIKIGT